MRITLLCAKILKKNKLFSKKIIKNILNTFI